VAPHPPSAEMRSSDGRLSAAQVFAALNEIRPTNTVLVEESPSNLSDLHKAWPITEPDTFYTFASGGLGWNLPASVGVALAKRDSGRNRPVITVIGDGSIDLERRAAASSHVDPRSAERGILHWSDELSTQSE
jgi:benzoylformate decarboxylase